MRYIKIVITVIFFLLLLTPFAAINLFFDADIWLPQYFVIIIETVLVLAMSFFLMFKKAGLVVHFNIILVCLCVLFGYIGVRLLFTPFSPAYMIYYYILALYLFLIYLIRYFILDNGDQWQMKAIIMVFLTSGAIEGIYGFLQLTGLHTNLLYVFKVHGTFNNPGPYTNYLVITLVFAFGFFLHFKQTGRFHNFLRYFSLTVAIIISVLLPFTGSRTSWLAALVGMIAVSWPLCRKLKWYGLMFGNGKRKTISLILAGIVAIIVCLSLFQYKSQSSKGRLLIYEVSFTMIKQHPVFGLGFCRFPAEYNNYQGSYFKENPESKKAILADNIKTCFNEFLQVWVELGLIGLLLFAGIVICIFSYKPKSGTEYLAIPAKGALLAVLVCCCFSYPLRILPVTVYIVFLIAIIAATYDIRTFSVKLAKKVYKPLILIVSVIALLMFYKQAIDFNARKTWDLAIKYTQRVDYKKAIPLYSKVYPVLNYDGFFLYNYGSELSEIDTIKSIQILEEATRYLSDNDLCAYLGDDYFAIKNYLKAEHYYILSQQMTPNKIYPRYQLFKLYCESGQLQKAYAVAQTISKMNVKIPSGTVYTMKEDIKQWLLRYK